MCGLLIAAALYVMGRQVDQFAAGDSYSDEKQSSAPPAAARHEQPQGPDISRALDLLRHATGRQQCNPERSLRLAREALAATPPEATAIRDKIEELIEKLEQRVDEPPPGP